MRGVIGFIRNRVPKSGFARNVATLTGATAVSQLMTLTVLPVLTRLYGPVDFGAAAVYAGVVGLIVVIATFRYELAIPLPRTDRAALHVAMISLVALIFVVFFAGFASSFLHLWLGDETGLSNWAFAALVMIGVLTAGTYQVANYWAVRKSKFGAVALTRIQQGFVNAGSQLVLGFAGFGVVGLIVGQIVGQCAGVARLTAGMIADNRQSGSLIHRRRLVWAAKRYRRFPLYDSWAGLLNIAGSQAPVLLFAALFSPALAGYYALAYRILSAPLGLIGKAVSQALLPRIVEANRHGEAGRLAQRLLSILAWISLPPFAILALTTEEIVPLAFGSEWTPAANIMSWTTLWVACQFIVSPLSISMVGLEALRLHTAVQLALFVLRVGAILLGAARLSPELAVIGFTLASVFGYLLYLSAIAFVTRMKPRQVLSALSGPALLSSVVALTLSEVFSLPQAARYPALTAFILFWVWRLTYIYKKKI